MCGILALLSNDVVSYEKIQSCKREFSKVVMRGPDDTQYSKVNPATFFGFHRLSIVGLTPSGNQPMTVPQHPTTVLICNGEIYNYRELAKKHDFKLTKGSDCEIIIHMYHKFGIKETVQQLDGVFAFVMTDNDKRKTFAGRDPVGVRSMYVGTDANKSIYICSEMKGIHALCTDIHPFPPGHYWEQCIDKYNSVTGLTYHRFYHHIYPRISDSESEIMCNIRTLLSASVKKRLMSDRPIGCLLSGGLDSSLITALIANHVPKGTLHTFSVGLPGSPDLYYAKMVADHLGTIHHEILLSNQELLGHVEDCIYQIESFDTTTVRASTPMFKMCQTIKQTTDVTVIFSGEGSDEASGSYMYFHNAPNADAFQQECLRLLEDLQYFDVLRCDKSTAGAGLEVRVPFLDKAFLQYYMSIDPELKLPRNGIEKYLLRKSFDNLSLLPDKVLWRMKEGMSDGVSSQTRSWYEIIQDKVDGSMSNTVFQEKSTAISSNPPVSKEAMYFREIFQKHYHKRDALIPYYWLPKWCGEVSEPSARVLNVYNS